MLVNSHAKTTPFPLLTTGDHAQGFTFIVVKHCTTELVPDYCLLLFQGLNSGRQPQWWVSLPAVPSSQSLPGVPIKWGNFHA